MLNYDNYLKTGIGKINNKWYKTLILGIMAGFFIALAGLCSTLVSYKIANPSVSKLLSGVIFPVGLIFVVLFQTELFTGNSLLSILLFKKDIKFKQLLKNWGLVYLGNLIGSIIFAILIYYSSLINSDIKIAIINTLNRKINLSIISEVILGVLCNILVCMAVFMASNGKTVIEKIILIFIPIMVFIICGFEHSVANMYFLSIGYMFSKVSILKILGNLLFVTIGNIIGGLFVSLYVYLTNKN